MTDPSAMAAQALAELTEACAGVTGRLLQQPLDGVLLRDAVLSRRAVITLPTGIAVQFSCSIEMAP